MTKISCNCVICAQEFNPDELQNVALSRINITSFKICEACLNASDPVDDYRQVRDIIYSYIKFSQAKSLFKEARDILDSRNSEK